MAGVRGRPPGKPNPNAGKKKGVPNSKEIPIEQIRNALKNDIYNAYLKLGPTWMEDLAQREPALFLSHCLSRILPPAARPEEVPTVAVQINNNPTDFELARRVAFIMRKSELEAPVKTIEHQPSEIDLANALAFKEACQQHQQPEPTPVPVGHTYSGSSVEQGRINPAPAAKKRRDLI